MKRMLVALIAVLVVAGPLWSQQCLSGSAALVPSSTSVLTGARITFGISATLGETSLRASLGVIDSLGNYTAPATAGIDTIRGCVNGVSMMAVVTVNQPPPPPPPIGGDSTWKTLASCDFEAGNLCGFTPQDQTTHVCNYNNEPGRCSKFIWIVPDPTGQLFNNAVKFRYVRTIGDDHNVAIEWNARGDTAKAIKPGEWAACEVVMVMGAQDPTRYGDQRKFCYINPNLPNGIAIRLHALRIRIEVINCTTGGSAVIDAGGVTASEIFGKAVHWRWEVKNPTSAMTRTGAMKIYKNGVLIYQGQFCTDAKANWTVIRVGQQYNDDLQFLEYRYGDNVTIQSKW